MYRWLRPYLMPLLIGDIINIIAAGMGMMRVDWYSRDINKQCNTINEFSALGKFYWLMRLLDIACLGWPPLMLFDFYYYLPRAFCSRHPHIDRSCRPRLSLPAHARTTPNAVRVWHWQWCRRGREFLIRSNGHHHHLSSPTTQFLFRPAHFCVFAILDDYFQIIDIWPMARYAMIYLAEPLPIADSSAARWHRLAYYRLVAGRHCGSLKTHYINIISVFGFSASGFPALIRGRCREPHCRKIASTKLLNTPIAALSIRFDAANFWKTKLPDACPSRKFPTPAINASSAVNY